jgi:hypothetical protein
MIKNKRWIKSVTETAKASDLPAMPWQRGARRGEMIARHAKGSNSRPRRHA